MNLRENVQAWILGSLHDPIVKILSENSHLTKVQLETLLIDVLSENFAGKQLKYDEKAGLRLIKSKISRGSFNRTLMQAKGNVINSIYTVLLLGYLGVFETISLSPYLAIAEKLHAYTETLKQMPEHEKTSTESLKIIHMVREELENSLKHLSSPSET
jgi:hypothetical protein